MSVHVSTLVWKVGGLTASQRLALLAIADHASDHGLAWPSHATLAAKCCTTERSLRRTLKSLVDDGWLRKTPGSGRISSRYLLNMQRLREGAQAQAEGAVEPPLGGPVSPPNHQGTITEPSSLSL